MALGALAAALLASAVPLTLAREKAWRIGLFPVGLAHVPPSLEPLRKTLKELGYAARALGLAIPRPVLLRADHPIQ